MKCLTFRCYLKLHLLFACGMQKFQPIRTKCQWKYNRFNIRFMSRVRVPAAECPVRELHPTLGGYSFRTLRVNG